MESDGPRTLGKYRLLEVVGRGGMGEVVKAWQPDLNRHVAIKTLLSGEQATEGFLERFKREARVAAGLAHPNIVQVFDFGTEGRLHYIVMEYVEGRSLKEVLAGGRLEPDRALRIALSVARTLQFAHERGVVHRDVKPANLLLDERDRVRILDFGLAKSLAEGKALTLSSTMLGTPYYMSPEQAFAAPEEVDARTDVYSLGAVLYEMLSGRPPFEGGTVLAILRQIEERDPAPPGISPAVDAVVLKALAKDRERRYPSAGEMAGALEACLGGAAVPAPPRRAPWALAGAALVLLALGAALGQAFQRPPAAPPPAPPAAAPDREMELRALLGRKRELEAADLAAYKDDPALSRIIARHFQDRGHYGKAVPFLKGYERAVGELMSARAIQRFVSPGLFKLSIAPPPDLKGSEALLMGALFRHLEGKQEAARMKLRNAENGGAPRAHVLLLRAHLELWDVWPDPQGEAQKQVLAALRAELEEVDEPFLLPPRAIVASLSGDPASAHEIADRFGKLAPLSAEAFMLQAVLLGLDGRRALALETLEDAAEAGGKALDVAVHAAYLRFLDLLRDPSREAGLAETAEALDERLKRDHYPAALFLRGVLHALEGDWDEAADALRKLAARTPLDRVVPGHELLRPFVWAGESRTRLLAAARDLRQHLGRPASAMEAARRITGEDLPEEDRGALLRDNHRWMARALADDEAKALPHLEAALRLGATPGELRDDPTIAALRPRPAFQALLRRYRETHRRLAKSLLGDDPAALAQLEEALRFGVRPDELRRDRELGELRERPDFAELLRRYEN